MKPETQPVSLWKSGGNALPAVRRLADGRLELLPPPAAEEVLLALWEAVAEGKAERLNALKARLAEKKTEG